MAPVVVRADRALAGAAVLRTRLLSHASGLGVIAGVTLSIMRRFVFTGGIPAGTDMLGFVSRAAQNASTGRVIDAWSPSSFGARRIFTFDNILGALTLVTRSPMVTVKLLDVLVLFGAGATAYGLAWSWYRKRLVATTAGLLYLASQASLTRWGSGQLNVEVIITLAPLMLLTWSACLQRFTLGRAAGFTLAVGVGLLVRADLVLYIAPFLALYAATALTTRQGFRAGLADAGRTLAVALPGILLVNAAWLVPSLTGYRAQYETLNQIFSLGQLATRSLDLYPSLLGFGREIGYFGFTGTETWYSYPGLPLWAYYAFATLLPVFSYVALRMHRDRRTVFLVVAAVIATLAAPGSHAPLGSVYLWAVQTLPVIGNLRDPNRWLIVQAIAYAVLAGLTIERMAAATSGLRARHSRQIYPRALVEVAVAVLAFAIAAVGLVPVLPTLVNGLRTWHVKHAQQSLLAEVRDASGPGRVASIPFDQDYRYLVQGTYQGYEHDLGYESALFTGRPDIGDGSWDQRSANFVAYEATLLQRRAPAFSALLASAGVNQLVSFNYPLVAPQFLSKGAGPYSQQRDASHIPGLVPLLTNPAGTDYRIVGAAAPLTFRRNIAVVLGGAQGMAALADQRGFRMSDWASFMADDVIETQGFRALLALIRKANIVLLADERPVDIAIEGTAPAARLLGITSDPQLDRLDTDVPTDRGAQAGALDDAALPIPVSGATSSTSAFTVRSARQVDIWARVLASPLAATIDVRVDGAPAGSITPVTLGTGGFEWVRLAAVHVRAGIHRVTLTAVPSRFGDNYEVEEARVLTPQALAAAEDQLNGALAAHPGRVAYSFNLADMAKWSWTYVYQRLTSQVRATYSMRAWTVPSGSETTMRPTTSPGGAAAPQFSSHPRRSVYAVIKLNYQRPRNWVGRPYVYLPFKGTGSHKRYDVIFDFGLGPENEARYTITDASRQWRTFAFSTANPGPGSGPTDWSRVHSVRIALASKAEPGTFSVGVPRPSREITSLPVVPGTGALSAAARKPGCVGGAHASPLRRLRQGTLMLPVSALDPSCSLFIRPRARYRPLPAVPVSPHRTGTESWSYSLRARQPGVLVWTQAYDPLWVLSGAGGAAPVPVMSLLDGYLVSPGRHAGTITFAGESSTITGIAISGLAALLLMVVAVVSRLRDRPCGTWPRADASRPRYIGPQPAPPRLRRVADLCLTAGVLLLTCCPAVSMTGYPGLLLPMSLLGVLACGVAGLIVAADRGVPVRLGQRAAQRRDHHRPGPGHPAHLVVLPTAVHAAPGGGVHPQHRRRGARPG